MRATFVPAAERRPAIPPWGLALAGLVLALIGGATIADGASAGRVWILLLFAPVIEETLFRAGLQEALLQRGHAPWIANLLTALAVGLAHVAVHRTPEALAVIVPALAIGAIYAARRRLRPCIALHAAMNAVWICWGLGQASIVLGF